MRLIDADALKELFKEKGSEAVCGVELCKAIISQIDNQPTVEAEPVKHGHWIMEFENDDGRDLRCSECRMKFYVGKGRDGNYCPNCGAKMEAERKEE